MTIVHFLLIWIITCLASTICSDLPHENVIFTNQPCPEEQEGIFYAVEHSKTQYKHCGPAGFFWIFPCSPDTFFNQLEQACLPFPNATTSTSLPKTTLTTEPSTSTVPATTTTVPTTTTSKVTRVTTTTHTIPSSIVEDTTQHLTTKLEVVVGNPETTFRPTESPTATTQTSGSPVTTALQTTAVHMFNAQQPILFATAGPDTDDYAEAYDEEVETSLSSAVTQRPTEYLTTTSKTDDYWEENTAESPVIPLHPRVSNAIITESKFVDLKTTTEQAYTKVQSVVIKPEPVKPNYIPADNSEPMYPQEGVSATDKHGYEYNVESISPSDVYVNPPEPSGNIYEIGQGSHVEDYGTEEVPINQPSQQLVLPYDNRGQGQTYNGYENSGPDEQVPEQVPESEYVYQERQVTTEAYHQKEYPQDENYFVHNPQQVNEKKIVQEPVTHRQPPVPVAGRTMGSKPNPRPVTLSPQAQELANRLSDKDLESMQRIFQSIVAQGGGPPPPGGGPPPHAGGPPPYGGGPPPQMGQNQGGQGMPDYSQFGPPPPGYAPYGPPRIPITEEPPTIYIAPSCVENGTCEFDASAETYCLHESIPTSYYQCGPSAEDIGIWMMRQCPGGLFFNDDGQCGRKKAAWTKGSTAKPVSAVVEPVSAVVEQSSGSSGWSQQNVQQPLQSTQVHSTKPRENVYPSENTNIKVSHPGGQQYPQTNGNYNPKPQQPFQQVVVRPDLVNVPIRPHPVRPTPTQPPVYNQYQQTFENGNGLPVQPVDFRITQEQSNVAPVNSGYTYPEASEIRHINNNVGQPIQYIRGNVEPVHVAPVKANFQPKPAVAQWVTNQQPTKPPLIPSPGIFQQPYQQSMNVVRGGTVPNSVVARLANLDSLAQILAARKVADQVGRPMMPINPYIPRPSPSSVPDTNLLAQYGAHYLVATNPFSFSQAGAGPQSQNLRTYGANVNPSNGYAVQNNGLLAAQANAHRQNLSPFYSPNQTPAVSQLGVSRTQYDDPWNSNEKGDKSMEPMYVWRPVQGQRCSLLASPKAQVFANPDDFKSFYMCTTRSGTSLQSSDASEGLWALLQCPDDTIFSPVLKVCDKSYADRLRIHMSKIKKSKRL